MLKKAASLSVAREASFVSYYRPGCRILARYASRILRTPLADFSSTLLGSDCQRDRSEITQVARVAGAERMDLLYSEGGGELFHSGVRVFLRHLA